ncbi:MAG: ASCH domain-containing protein [Phycisphaerales bacterium]
MPDTHTPTIQAFIARFLAQPDAPRIDPADIPTDTFGDSPEMADRLLALVLDTTKTATCSSLWAWEHEQQQPPTPGQLAVILDGASAPRCIIETTSVETMPYNQVPADFARAEGEHTPLDLPDEQVLEHWREGHWAFFTRTLTPLGLTPAEDMPLVCERFRVVYAERS